MGLIVNGKWVDNWYDTTASKGKFERQESRFRATISNEPDSQYPVEADRYHLYVSLACPWAHRTLIFRQLKQLEGIISVSVVQAQMLENGWEFGEPGTPYEDNLYQQQYLYELYLKSASDYQGRVTVPVLWDKKTQTIVNNESSDIIRIFNTAFNQLTGNDLDFYPEHLRSDIDQINERIYHTINNGVYRVGFATSQVAYEQAYDELFESLDWLEQHLSANRYLMGDTLTEADWRLLTTLLRFDAVYHGHFKCNRNKLNEFHHISNYVRELYQVEGIASTVDIPYTKLHYYGSHRTINPTLVVPKGPEQNFDLPHDRASI
ncbi:putative glutathione S-transferase [Pseudoalteromonas ulvae UL12]|uniref:Glutathione-dependent reductase n=1 Tax=Pseudoalteromonas ulvae TaxID=107327 RepID=A0A244CVE4_PSEDV|nr:glutathione S-transferase family protein [Pseudoalteromonas ulvae]MBE0362427.1 putative glutathione S-transferase [Pseudoalteromonas ulvae UL12]OUL59585.1 glutathione-dependent reductase [Pseudoalteromonas ulvae]